LPKGPPASPLQGPMPLACTEIRPKGALGRDAPPLGPQRFPFNLFLRGLDFDAAVERMRDISAHIRTLRGPSEPAGVLFWCVHGRHRSAGTAACALIASDPTLSPAAVMARLEEARPAIDFRAAWGAVRVSDFVHGFAAASGPAP
jgi:hypothetical protein